MSGGIIDTVIIGAGWSGLTAGGMLKQAGHDVMVVEKSRGPGGRSATRREGRARFDHGAQYFTARSGAFARQLQQWRDLGLVQQWNPRLTVFGERGKHKGSEDTRRFVGVPGMNAICKFLADGLECRFSKRVVQATFDGRWRIELECGEAVQARRLLLSMPPAQAAAMLGVDDPLHQQLSDNPFDPCIAALLTFDKAPELGFDAAFVNQPGPLRWIASDSNKPGRQGRNWVLHAGATWSREHLDGNADTLGELLAEAFAALVDQPLPATRRVLAHRWRYAQVCAPLEQGFIGDGGRRLAIAGDWLSGSRIEGAWTSGRRAGQWLAESE